MKLIDMKRYIYKLIRLVILSIGCLYNFILSAQSIGDVRACFDVDLQDTIIWFELDIKESNSNKNGKIPTIAYIIFEQNGKVHFEKWHTVKTNEAQVRIYNMRSLPDSIWENPTNKFNPIVHKKDTLNTDTIIEYFNNFRDQITTLSENPTISNDWKRFLRITIPTSMAILTRSYNTHPYISWQYFELYYLGNQIMNSLLILRYIDCLNKKDFTKCFDGSFLFSPRIRSFKLSDPINFSGCEIYAFPQYQNQFYNSIIQSIPIYIKKYPNYKDFINSMYFPFQSKTYHGDFDSQLPIINSFEDH